MDVVKAGQEVLHPEEESAGEGNSAPKGLKIRRRFTQPGVNVYDTVQWERRTAQITGEKGEVVFEQHDVEVPAFWSQIATNVVVSKYFRGKVGSPERETSVRQMISRVVDTITRWGAEQGYFATGEDVQAFYDELTHLLLYQKASFNSPVWFNVGVVERPQCSACFIQSVEDSMESIMDLAKSEALLFKGGSGTGTNLSPLRSSREHLSGGGIASGPVSFMKGYDAFAGVIKSGGKTRRAAKMVILNADHPDIVEFIQCKAEEEKKAWALIEQGYDPGFNVPGGAYDSVFFQNANHSVRVNDAFMQAVEEDGEWKTYAVTTGEVMGVYKARDLFRMMAEAAWICGDPGIQFHDTINDWHTCPNTGPINASNPCSEYLFLDDSACNLASLNLMKFRREDGRFDVESFVHACEIMITAQEIIVDNASYPTSKIEKNSHDYRPLGLGYANLGALLMANGLPYDSEEARALAGVITAVMTGAAYRQSARMAQVLGPFPGFERNREPCLRVLRKHRNAVDEINPVLVPTDLIRSAREIWEETIALADKYGVRNAQATVIAPTGTISFLMDCDTTGIEPDIALVKYKKLVGGGLIKIVNNTVPEALRRLGYSEEQIGRIVAYIDQNDTIEGAPDLKEEHLPVFDCAFRPAKGKRSIDPMGHIKMMAAVQPFVSGSISKTVNMPKEATPEDIERIYMSAWKLGLKCIAVYRDGCKRTQPLSTRLEDEDKKVEWKPVRRKLPDERKSITHKFSVAGHEGYITVGMYEDGSPGEIFLIMNKEGSVISGLMDSFATAISLALQYGVPLKALVDKFSHVRFEPAGVTNNPEIPIAKSVVDYIFRWLALKFLPPEDQPGGPVKSLENGSAVAEKRNPGSEALEKEVFRVQSDAPPCPDCGAIMVRSGACYQCPNCGTTSGCG